MIMDTKESWVEKATTDLLCVILPRPFKAMLRMLFLLSRVCSAGEEISGFAFEYSYAFWQVPLMHEEGKFYCATAKLDGKRRYLAYLSRAGQL